MSAKSHLSRRAAVALLLASAAPAVAQAPSRVRVRGRVEKIEAGRLSVATADSGVVNVQLSEGFALSSLEKASAADIKPGMFVGAGALPQPDGVLKAVQVTIFPENLRGTGEGHRAWDVLPESTMTNANVSEAVAGVNGAVLTLAYKGGEKKLVFAPDTLFLKLGPADAAELKVGAEVSLFADKAADGALKAGRVTVSRGGAASL